MKKTTRGVFLFCCALFMQNTALAVSSEQVLEKALNNFFPNNSRSELIMANVRDGREIFKRKMNVVIVKEEGSMKVKAEFTYPQEIRYTTAIMYERKNGCSNESESIPPNDYWIYLPALGKPRRISGSQRKDSFFGTELSHGDMEPRRACHFKNISLTESRANNEKIYVITAEPKFDAGYDIVKFYVSSTNYNILKTEQIKIDAGGSEKIYKVIDAPANKVKKIKNYVLPMEIIVTNPKTEASTIVRYTKREILDNIPNSEVSLTSLQKGH